MPHAGGLRGGGHGCHVRRQLRAHAGETATQQLRIVTFRDFGWEMAHGAVTRRPPIPLYTIVPRTGGYAYDVGVWDLSIVQGP